MKHALLAWLLFIVSMTYLAVEHWPEEWPISCHWQGPITYDEDGIGIRKIKPIF